MARVGPIRGVGSCRHVAEVGDDANYGSKRRHPKRAGALADPFFPRPRKWVRKRPLAHESERGLFRWSRALRDLSPNAKPDIIPMPSALTVKEWATALSCITHHLLAQPDWDGREKFDP